MDDITAYEIGQNVLVAIQTWDKRVSIEKIRITPDYDNNIYLVYIRFYIEGLKEIKEIDYILKKL